MVSAGKIDPLPKLQSHPVEPLRKGFGYPALKFNFRLGAFFIGSSLEIARGGLVQNSAVWVGTVKSRLLVLGMLMLASCGTSADAEGEVNGWGPFTLGMGYDEALAALPEASWNPSALKECRDQLAVEGCFLSQYGNIWYKTIDGIAFSPTLEFDRNGKLIIITLKYENEGKITRDQCLDIYARAVDHLHNEYGPVAFAKEREEKGWKRDIRKTAGGVEYAIGLSDKGFVSAPMRAQVFGAKPAFNGGIANWNDKRYASVLGALISMPKYNTCHVSLTVSEPQSVIDGSATK